WRSLAKAALCSPFRKQIDRRRRRTGRNATLARHSHGLQLLLRNRTRRLAREMLTDWSNARNYDGKGRAILHARRWSSVIGESSNRLSVLIHYRLSAIGRRSSAL